jgi:hypothetical protein
LQGPPKFTQIWIFGLKTNHLATLLLALFRFTAKKARFFQAKKLILEGKQEKGG